MLDIASLIFTCCGYVELYLWMEAWECGKLKYSI